MDYFLRLLGMFALSLILSQFAYAQQDSAKFVPRIKNPLIKIIEKHADSLKAASDSVTAAIQKRQKTEKDLKDSTATELRFDISRIVRPNSPDEFSSVFHFPPTPQDWTGNCWAFAGTSFFESEIFRLSGRKIRLSEMYTVYFEYIEKVRRYVRERGESAVGSGSEENALLRVMKTYGAVPREVFDGLNPVFPHYNHDELESEINKYLDFVTSENLWDEDAVIASIRVILDKYIGRPPETFTFENRPYTPGQFLTDVLKLNLDNYMYAMSTLKVPFYTRGLYDVPDNWWRDSAYYNLPLDDWYAVIKEAIQQGYSLNIGGATSEPGYYGIENIAIIPDFDIPQDYINQDSREYRFYRGTTGDDHCMHLVGYLRHGDHDWFLIKDSGGASRTGELKGYFFFRDDYVRLKMLTIMVHKDILQDFVKKKGDQ